MATRTQRYFAQQAYGLFKMRGRDLMNATTKEGNKIEIHICVDDQGVFAIVHELTPRELVTVTIDIPKSW